MCLTCPREGVISWYLAGKPTIFITWKCCAGIKLGRGGGLDCIIICDCPQTDHITLGLNLTYEPKRSPVVIIIGCHFLAWIDRGIIPRKPRHMAVHTQLTFLSFVLLLSCESKLYIKLSMRP